MIAYALSLVKSCSSPSGIASDESAVVESEEVEPGVILDYNDDGKVVGMELLGISARVTPERLRVLQFETV